MRLHSIFLKTLSGCTGLLKGWGAAGGVLSIGMTVLYAASATAEELPDWLDAAAAFFQDLPGELPGVPGEWLLEAVWFVALPVFLALFSTELGSRLLAGREQDGQLELLLAYPLSRRRLLLENYAVLAAATAGLTLLVWLFSGLGLLAAGGVFTASGTALELFLAALVFGSLAFALSGRTGRRGKARGITLAVLALAVLLELAGRAIPRPVNFLQYLSPLADFAGSHLANGLRPGFALLLAGLAALLVVLALLGFDRREIE